MTAALSVTYAPPVAKGGLDEEVFDLGSGVQTVAAGADFTGEGLSFAVTGAGATIDAKTGLVSIPTDSGGAGDGDGDGDELGRQRHARASR